MDLGKYRGKQSFTVTCSNKDNPNDVTNWLKQSSSAVTKGACPNGEVEHLSRLSHSHTYCVDFKDGKRWKIIAPEVSIMICIVAYHLVYTLFLNTHSLSKDFRKFLNGVDATASACTNPDSLVSVKLSYHGQAKDKEISSQQMTCKDGTPCTKHNQCNGSCRIRIRDTNTIPIPSGGGGFMRCKDGSSCVRNGDCGYGSCRIRSDVSSTKNTTKRNKNTGKNTRTGRQCKDGSSCVRNRDCDYGSCRVRGSLFS